MEFRLYSPLKFIYGVEPKIPRGVSIITEGVKNIPVSNAEFGPLMDIDKEKTEKNQKGKNRNKESVIHLVYWSF